MKTLTLSNLQSHLGMRVIAVFLTLSFLFFQTPLAQAIGPVDPETGADVPVPAVPVSENGSVPDSAAGATVSSTPTDTDFLMKVGPGGNAKVKPGEEKSTQLIPNKYYFYSRIETEMIKSAVIRDLINTFGIPRDQLITWIEGGMVRFETDDHYKKSGLTVVFHPDLTLPFGTAFLPDPLGFNGSLPSSVHYDVSRVEIRCATADCTPFRFEINSASFVNDNGQFVQLSYTNEKGESVLERVVIYNPDSGGKDAEIQIQYRTHLHAPYIVAETSHGNGSHVTVTFHNGRILEIVERTVKIKSGKELETTITRFDWALACKEGTTCGVMYRINHLGETIFTIGFHIHKDGGKLIMNIRRAGVEKLRVFTRVIYPATLENVLYVLGRLGKMEGQWKAAEKIRQKLLDKAAQAYAEAQNQINMLEMLEQQLSAYLNTSYTTIKKLTDRVLDLIDSLMDIQRKAPQELREKIKAYVEEVNNYILNELPERVKAFTFSLEQQIKNVQSLIHSWKKYSLQLTIYSVQVSAAPPKQLLRLAKNFPEPPSIEFPSANVGDPTHRLLELLDRSQEFYKSKPIDGSWVEVNYT